MTKGDVVKMIAELATEVETSLYQLVPSLNQLVTNLSVQVKKLIINLNNKSLSPIELQLVIEHAPKSRPYFKKHYLDPAVELDLVTMTHPENPKHPKQKYYLTEKGKELLKTLQTQS